MSYVSFAFQNIRTRAERRETKIRGSQFDKFIYLLLYMYVIGVNVTHVLHLIFVGGFNQSFFLVAGGGETQWNDGQL